MTSLYSLDEYNKLKTKYGAYSSWAIWDCLKEGNTAVIDLNFQELSSKFILLGLNISATLDNKPWINFHGGKHDRKLKYACNNTKLRGAYITDLFKDIPESKSSKLKRKLTDKIINQNVMSFQEEMKDIKINNESQFIIFGTENSQVSQMFNKYFKKSFDNKVICHYHYSFYGITDQLWVNGLWKKLGITEDFDSTIQMYKHY